jgi:hypothetical protein
MGESELEASLGESARPYEKTKPRAKGLACGVLLGRAQSSVPNVKSCTAHGLPPFLPRHWGGACRDGAPREQVRWHRCRRGPVTSPPACSCLLLFSVSPNSSLSRPDLRTDGTFSYKGFEYEMMAHQRNPSRANYGPVAISAARMAHLVFWKCSRLFSGCVRGGLCLHIQ